MTPDNIPTFPQNDAAVNRINNHEGMTLLDYAAIEFAKAWVAVLTTKYPDCPDHSIYTEANRRGFTQAAAMLEERKKHV